jgi:dTDP-4-dehydrorhamnose 3,5-epimerase
MNLNLIVPIGTVRFVLYDDRANSLTNGIYQEVILSQVNYSRLTIPPNIWVGFQCIDQNISMLLNIADIEHIAEESDKKGLNDIKYSWELKK